MVVHEPCHCSMGTWGLSERIQARIVGGNGSNPGPSLNYQPNDNRSYCSGFSLCPKEPTGFEPVRKAARGVGSPQTVLWTVCGEPTGLALRLIWH